jgi:hypothetical protein
MFGCSSVRLDTETRNVRLFGSSTVRVYTQIESVRTFEGSRVRLFARSSELANTGLFPFALLVRPNTRTPELPNASWIVNPRTPEPPNALWFDVQPNPRTVERSNAFMVT